MAIRKNFLTREEIMLYKLQSVQRVYNQFISLLKAILAQLVEQLIRNQQVGGSIPPDGSIFQKLNLLSARLFSSPVPYQCLITRFEHICNA
jgi:hypothetical protein